MRERYQVKWRPGWVAVPAALITAKLSRNARLCWTILAHQAQANSSSDMKSLGELLADGDKPAPDRKTIRGWVEELEKARWLTRYRTVAGNEYELHEPSAAPPLPDDPEPQAPAGDQPTAPAAPAEAEPEEPQEDDITWQTFHDELTKLNVKAAHKLQGVAIPNRAAALKHVQAMAAAGAGGGAIFNWVRDEGHKPIAVADSDSFIERNKRFFQHDQPLLDEQPDESEPTPAPQPQRTRGQRAVKPNLSEVIDPEFIDHVQIVRWPSPEEPYCLLGFSSDRAKEDFRPHSDRIKEWIAQVSHVNAVTAVTWEATVFGSK